MRAQAPRAEGQRLRDSDQGRTLLRQRPAHAYEPLHIRHQCEQSLQNLGRDYIDLYFLHHGDFGPKGEWLQGALAREGKIRLKGQSAYSEEHFLLAVPVVKPAVLQS